MPDAVPLERQAVETAQLRLVLLGPPALASEAGPVHLATRKALALLAYLAVRREAALRSDLAALLWPEHGEEQARRSLRQELSRLGHVLGPERLQAGREQVRLREGGFEVDLWSFRAARAAGRHRDAVDLYRGPLLQGLFLRETVTFEAWLAAAREEVQSEYLESLSRLARNIEAEGRYVEALALIRRAIADDPLAEGFYLEAMRLATAAGDRSGALRLYQELERQLRQELGVEPGPEARALAREIGAGLAAPSPLPSPTLPLSGRREEFTELLALIDREDCRLLSLVGAGGVGKTRLALEVAGTLRHAEKFPDGVHWVELRGPFLFPRLGDILGLPLYGRGDVERAVMHRLRDQRALLVLDEAEELASDAGMLERLLDAAPVLKIFLTSRERLRLRSEWVYHLHGLPVPEPGVPAEGNAAAELFCRAAERVRPGFRPTTQDWAAIAEVCRLVSGLPLALELAGSWVRVLSCSQIQGELEQSLDLLEGAPPHLPARQQSLRTVIDSMLARLSPEERQTLTRLAVFRGGFTMDAARKVAGSTPAILASTADRALLRQSPEGHYAILEMVRQHLHHEVPVPAYESHAAYYATFLEEREERLKGGSQPQALGEVGAEIENIRAAWAWSIQHGRVENATRMMESLFLFHELRGWFRQGAQLFALGRGLPDSPARYKALSRMGRFEYRLGRYVDAEATMEEALGLARAGNVRDEVAFLLSNLGLVALGLGRPALARERLEEALTVRRQTGARWGTANVLFNLGLVAIALGEYPGARVHFQEALELYQSLIDARGTSLAFWGLGQAWAAVGDYGAARELFREGLSAGDRLGDPFAAASNLLGLGGVERLQGRHPEGRDHLEASLRRFREVGDQGWTARALLGMGQIMADAGDLDGAAALQREALELSRGSASHWGEALALAYLAETATRRNDPDEARTYARLALDGARALQSVPLTLRVLLATATVLPPNLAVGVLNLIRDHPASEHDVRSEAESRAQSLRRSDAPFADLSTAVRAIKQALAPADTAGE